MKAFLKTGCSNNILHDVYIKMLIIKLKLPKTYSHDLLKIFEYLSTTLQKKLKAENQSLTQAT